jgi:hypothetical protein
MLSLRGNVRNRRRIPKRPRFLFFRLVVFSCLLILISAGSKMPVIQQVNPFLRDHRREFGGLASRVDLPNLWDLKHVFKSFWTTQTKRQANPKRERRAYRVRPVAHA